MQRASTRQLQYLLQLFLIVFTFLTSMSCKTKGVVIENSNLPLVETRKTISGVIGKPRIISLNGREMSSLFHDSKFVFLNPEKSYKFRYFTKVIILGARRPYEIQVLVYKQLLDPKVQDYVDLGIDLDLTQTKAIEIQLALAKSLETIQRLDGDAPF